MKLMGHIGQTYKEKYWSRHELDELYARKS